MQGCLYMDTNFVTKDTPKPNSTGTKTVNVCIMNLVGH